MTDAILGNQAIILKLLGDLGSQEYGAIRYECLTQGGGGDADINTALQMLCDMDIVEQELIFPELEGDDPYYVYNLTTNSVN